MRAELRTIEPPDFDWDTFARAEQVKPVNDFGWFMLSIGPEGSEGADVFLALVSTPASASRARQGKSFCGFIVPSFEAEIIRHVLDKYVASVEGQSWQEIVEQLRDKMRWEYEGMEPV